MNIEQERAQFEAWYRLHHGSRDVYGRDASGEYADKQVQGAFNVWQARAALIDLADDIRAALAAQPAVGEEIMVNAAHDVFTLPLQPSGLSSGPRFVVHVPAQPAASACVGCEGKPAPENNPCAVCSKSAASAEPVGEVVVTWTQDRSRIVAVTRQDEEGRILSVIAEAPVAAQAPQNDDETEGMRAHIALLRASLAQAEQELDDLRVATQAPAVPEGWKLVPVEPTLEMLDSADDAIRDFPRPVSRYETPLAPKIAYYKAMLAAAPTPPASAAPAADGDALDAARYQLLRRKVCIAGGKFHILNLDPRYIAPDAAVELDAAIDAAMQHDTGSEA